MTNQTADRLILVTNATGRQGSATLEHLRADGGFRIRAMTRDPQSEKARVLTDLGIEVVAGTQTDPASLDAAMDGVYGVFGYQAAVSIEEEALSGRNVADAAKRAGVSHLVASLSASAGFDDTGVPRFENKRALALYVLGLGVPYTILRPPTFMDNFLAEGTRADILKGKTTGLMSASTRQWFVTVDDIGLTAAAAFANPDKFLGQEVDIAGDELTQDQIADTFGQELSRPVLYIPTPPDAQGRLPQQTLQMNEWYESVGYSFDVPALQAKWGLPWMSLRDWIRKTGWTK